jgi:hypothetical protein
VSFVKYPCFLILFDAARRGSQVHTTKGGIQFPSHPWALDIWKRHNNSIVNCLVPSVTMVVWYNMGKTGLWCSMWLLCVSMLSHSVWFRSEIEWNGSVLDSENEMVMFCVW